MARKDVSILKIAVMGKDGRFVKLRDLLAAQGHEVTDSSGDADVTVTRWPPEGKLCGGTVFTCGPAYAPKGVHDLLQDEDYQRKIAWMTAEGAIAAVMGKTGCAINGAECLVVGWGRIGRALAERLAALGGRVTVLTRSREKWREIEECGAVPGFTEDAEYQIRAKRFVFSTPPAMVISEKVLQNAGKDAVIIDLASPPYGVDVAAAEKIGIKAWREPGIPGRYCPENAAMAIYESIGGMIDD